MSDELQNNIDGFLRFFQRKLEGIKNAEFDESTQVFKKILYLGLIDALSKSVTLPKNSNRERITCSIAIKIQTKIPDQGNTLHLGGLG